MRKATILSLLFFSFTVSADVLDVGIWKPMPGMGPTSAEYAAEAKAIQEKLGAQVGVAFDTMGRMHYAMTFPNWTEWAKFGAKLDKSKAWSQWQKRTTEKPSATLEDQYLLDVASPGGAGPVYEVFIWEAEGPLSALIASAMEAEAIHEKAGSDVSINVDQLNRMHYVMSFDSWEAWGKFRDTPNEEFQKWWEQASKNPAGKLVKVYTASNI